MALVALACNRKPTIYVPRKDTAVEQYAYALEYRQQHTLRLRNRHDDVRLEETRERIRQLFSKVVEYFPEDRVTSPLARLDIVEIQCGQDGSHYQPSKRDLKGAIASFRLLREDYPEYDYIQVKTRYNEARCLLLLKEFPRAQGMFKYLVDVYANDADPTIRQIVSISATYYNQAYVD